MKRARQTTLRPSFRTHDLVPGFAVPLRRVRNIACRFDTRSVAGNSQPVRQPEALASLQRVPVTLWQTDFFEVALSSSPGRF